MRFGLPAAEAVRSSPARSHGQPPRFQAANDKRRPKSLFSAWCMLPPASHALPCSCSLLVLLCSWIEMRLLLAAHLPILTSDHLFCEVLSAACRADICVTSRLEVALSVSSLLLQSIFETFSCAFLPGDKEDSLVCPEKPQSLCSTF
jgi:hypothetical protein